MSAPSLTRLLVTDWQLSSSVWAPAAASVLLYLWGAARCRGSWPLRPTLSFLAGIGSVLVALQSGIGTYDDRLLSVHMVQHMLLLLIAPVLLLCGRPFLLALRAASPRARPMLARALAAARNVSGPLQCVGVFTAVVIATHLPRFYDATLGHPLLHDAEHGLYLLAGSLLWWPILDGDPAPRRRLGGLAKLGYLLAAMVPMALVGAYLNRKATLAYAPYGPASRALGISPLADQAQAGAIMWVAGNTIMIAVGLWAVIAALVAEERRQRLRDARGASVTAGRPEAPA